MAATAALRRTPVTGVHRNGTVAAMGSSYIGLWRGVRRPSPAIRFGGTIPGRPQRREMP